MVEEERSTKPGSDIKIDNSNFPTQYNGFPTINSVYLTEFSTLERIGQ